MTKESRRPPAAGLYDEPITRGRDADLAALDAALVHHASLEEHEAPAALARLLHDRIESALKSVPKDNKVEEQLVLANRVLDALRTHAPKAKLTDDDDLAAPPRRLLAVLEPALRQSETYMTWAGEVVVERTLYEDRRDEDATTAARRVTVV